ncbi:Histidine-specific methyltransferase SAM-dependent [Aspergillus parasiticus SU-1]|uniref:Histidine-specific methyltransferase SAM-dependent n=1 Tax=Aspergillus parasiticus (strain ATCC 56775 / NRRL 5862 / SRRC 143 / SU-1) TaxID=1403190 RepID=A0A0F0IKG2_ASPPU|nr:Histidine-specific methyltransferase SAM-dependent [Aspergillus parasiticus SU-1]
MTVTTATTTNMVSPSKGSGNIIDIGTGTTHDTVESQEKQVLQQRLLKQQDGKRWLPTALIWEDESAHRLWWEANTLDEFYSIRDEVNLLKRWEQDIARQVLDHSVLIDLGCGSPSTSSRNWYRLCDYQGRMLLGLDACDDDEKVWRSYNDVNDCWHRMIRNGLVLSNKVLGHEWYRPEDWEVIGVCHRRSPTLTHRCVARAIRVVRCEPLDLHFAPGEEIVTNEWYKYSPNEMQKQFGGVGLSNIRQWKLPSGPVYDYLLALA